MPLNEGENQVDAIRALHLGTKFCAQRRLVVSVGEKSCLGQGSTGSDQPPIDLTRARRATQTEQLTGAVNDLRVGLPQRRK